MPFGTRKFGFSEAPYQFRRRAFTRSERASRCFSLPQRLAGTLAMGPALAKLERTCAPSRGRNPIFWRRIMRSNAAGRSQIAGRIGNHANDMRSHQPCQNEGARASCISNWGSCHYDCAQKAGNRTSCSNVALSPKRTMATHSKGKGNNRSNLILEAHALKLYPLPVLGNRSQGSL